MEPLGISRYHWCEKGDTGEEMLNVKTEKVMSGEGKVSVKPIVFIDMQYVSAIPLHTSGPIKKPSNHSSLLQDR